MPSASTAFRRDADEPIPTKTSLHRAPGGGSRSASRSAATQPETPQSGQLVREGSAGEPTKVMSGSRIDHGPTGGSRLRFGL